MKILITGGCGFVRSNLCLFLKPKRNVFKTVLDTYNWLKNGKSKLIKFF